MSATVPNGYPRSSLVADPQQGDIYWLPRQESADGDPKTERPRVMASVLSVDRDLATLIYCSTSSADAELNDALGMKDIRYLARSAPSTVRNADMSAFVSSVPGSICRPSRKSSSTDRSPETL